MEMGATSDVERNKAVVRRLVAEVLNGGKLDVIDELYAPELAAEARDWIAPFLASFPDTRMEIVDLIAEGNRVAARFACSGTHTGEWLGHAPTGRRFEQIDEASFYRIRGGRIVESWGVEDTLRRLEQLGLG
jgi:predicted ester cyclase